MASLHQSNCHACNGTVDLLIRSQACRHLLCQTCASLSACPACRCYVCMAEEVTTRGQCPHGLCTNCFVTLGLDGEQSRCRVCQEAITGLYVSIYFNFMFRVYFHINFFFAFVSTFNPKLVKL